MPLFFQQHLNANTRLAVWKIAEDEAFFKVPLQRSITHPHKRLQHLAGRYLLRFLFPEFPLHFIQIADTRKPFLEDEAYHFSISHCSDFAAAIVSTQNRVGVDIEVVWDKIQRVQHKFASEEEITIVNDAWPVLRHNPGLELPNSNPISVTPQLTLIWCCKEAVFKWYGSGEVDFKGHMQVQHMHSHDAELFQTSICFKKEQEQLLLLQSRFFNDVCLSYLVT